MLLGLLTAVAATACTKSEAGQAAPPQLTDPTPTGSSPSRSSGAQTPTATIPARPRELKLTGVDPCSLVTQPQRAELKIDRTRNRPNGSQQYKDMPECVLSIEKQQPFYQYVVTAATNEGIGPWLSGKRNVEAKLTSVEGFAAATFWSRGAHDTNADGCTIAVDVADGQQLMVDTDNDAGHSFTLEQLCQRAQHAAGLAMRTLQTR
jgi:hypothetical protein